VSPSRAFGRGLRAEGKFRCIARNVVAKMRGIHKNAIKLNAHFYFVGLK
jgi:hypothetical protein